MKLTIESIPVKEKKIRNNYVLENSSIRRSLVGVLSHMYYDDVDDVVNKNWTIKFDEYDSEGCAVFRIVHNETQIRLWASCTDMNIPKRFWFVFISMYQYKKLKKM